MKIMIDTFIGINPEEVNQDKKGFNRVYNPLDIIYKSKSGGCIYVGEPHRRMHQYIE